MIAVPFFLAVTVPFLFTFATVLLLLSNLTAVCFAIGLSFLTCFALIANVSPTLEKANYIELYDKVKLTNGSIATIVEILSNNEVYIADVEVDDDYELNLDRGMRPVPVPPPRHPRPRRSARRDGDLPRRPH